MYIEQLCGRWVKNSPNHVRWLKKAHRRALRRAWKRFGEDAPKRMTKGWSD